jgi:hypothetical protein
VSLLKEDDVCFAAGVIVEKVVRVQKECTALRKSLSLFSP